MVGVAAQIAEEFLAVVWGSNTPDDEALLRAIDRLLYRSHEVGPADCADSDDEPPATDGPKLFEQVAQRFPTLGMYPVADPLGSISEDTTLGSAIDDIADVTKDLREVVWRDQYLGSDDAAWFFRLMHFHWARHARELGLYLQARQQS